MMLTGGALATALTVLAGSATAGSTMPVYPGIQAAAAAAMTRVHPGIQSGAGATAPGDGTANGPGGAVFGGVTPQGWPVVVALNQARNRVDRVAIGLDMTCTSGDSFGTSDRFQALKLSRKGRFSTTFGPQRIDAGGVPADVESRVVGRMSADRASVRGIWSLRITLYDPATAAVVDTCESGLVSWKARQ
jgi:hypothetical protein